MGDWKKFDIRQARKDFAQRLERLIGDKKNPENLQNFHQATGRPVPKLISWRNPEHTDWPDMKSLLYICVGADVSPTWLLLGGGRERLSSYSNPAQQSQGPPARQVAGGDDGVRREITETLFGLTEKTTGKTKRGVAHDASGNISPRKTKTPHR